MKESFDSKEDKIQEGREKYPPRPPRIHHLCKAVHIIQRSYQRWLDKRMYKTEMKFWAVLGQSGCKEKKPPDCHKYATFFGGFFNFLWAKKVKIF